MIFMPLAIVLAFTTPQSCQITNIDFDHVPEMINKKAIVIFQFDTSPSDQQRDISGFATIFYNFKDPYTRRITKASSFVSLSGHAPEDEITTDIEVSFWTEAAVETITDVQFSLMSCRIGGL